MDSRLSSDDEYDYRMRILTERQDLRHAAYKEYDNTPKHSLSPEQVQYHFEQYAAYRQQQLDWGPDDLFLEALSRLPNLVSVENAKHGFADNHLHFPWNRIEKDIIINPNNWMQLHAVEVDDDEEVHVLDVLKYPIHMQHADCLLKAIGHRANLGTGSPIRKLRLVNVGGQPFLDMSEHYALTENSASLPTAREALYSGGRSYTSNCAYESSGKTDQYCRETDMADQTAFSGDSCHLIGGSAFTKESEAPMPR